MASQDTSAARLAMISAAVAGDSGTLFHLAAGLLDDGVPFETVLFEVLVSIEDEVGHRWQQGDYLVSEEHAATAALETVISLLAGAFDQPEEAAAVVVATAEGDDHSLPGRAVAAHLLSLGYRTIFLGANVLSSDLAEYLREEKPDALVLACAMTVHLPGARSAIRASHGAGTPVVVGGRAFGEDSRWARALGADAWVPSLSDVARTLETWDPDIGAAEAEARDPSAELRSLMGARPGIIARASGRLTESGPDHWTPRLLTELGLLLSAVEASLLVDDLRPVVDMLSWQRRTLTAHGYDDPGALVRVLRDALPGPVADRLRLAEREAQV